MTEHTRESDELLLIGFVLEVAGSDQQEVIDAAVRLQDILWEETGGEKVKIKSLVDNLPTY